LILEKAEEEEEEEKIGFLWRVALCVPPLRTIFRRLNIAIDGITGLVIPESIRRQLEKMFFSSYFIRGEMVGGIKKISLAAGLSTIFLLLWRLLRNGLIVNNLPCWLPPSPLL
jgi:hypothetical protein